MGDHIATQEANPRSAVLRTIVAVALSASPLLNGVLAAETEAQKPYEAFVPRRVFLGLNAILVAVTALAVVVSRVLALPGVNEWLSEHGLLR